MWTGEITSLEHELDPECWAVWIETPQSGIYKDCTTEAIWNTLEVGQQYTLTNPQQL